MAGADADDDDEDEEPAAPTLAPADPAVAGASSPASFLSALVLTAAAFLAGPLILLLLPSLVSIIKVFVTNSFRAAMLIIKTSEEYLVGEERG